MRDINPYTQSPARAYAKRVRAAKNWEELEKAVLVDADLAQDALEVLQDPKRAGMPWANWATAKRLAKMQNITNAEVEAVVPWMPLLMPAVMAEAESIAAVYKVPWGLAYLRLKAVGRIVERDGAAYIAPSPEAG